jgi:hypothetical protein
MPILYRRSFNFPNDAIRKYYGILIRISSGYLPDRGRLHTRYAPVRHSSASEDLLPFDLHVLGLPLAFILSQDQTLRCKIICILKSQLKLTSFILPFLLSLSIF